MCRVRPVRLIPMLSVECTAQNAENKVGKKKINMINW